MIPPRFTVALTLLVAVAASVDAVASHRELTKVASEATKTIPQLRAKETNRKSRYGKTIRSLKTNVEKIRSLAEDEEADEDEANDQDEDEANQQVSYSSYNDDDVGFAMTDYSFKYTGCSTIQTWNEDQAENAADSVLSSKRFATFRLCEDCSDDSDQGCSSNYGEYVVAMDQFLLAMTEFNEERVLSYCQYCDSCAQIESFVSFIAHAQELRNSSLVANEEIYAEWLEANVGDDDTVNGAELYYQYVKSGNQNANNNQNANYANSYTNYNNANYQDYGDDNYMYQMSQSQQWWKNAGSNGDGGTSYSSQSWNFGQSSDTTFMGMEVLPGYYDDDGAFVEEWGFISQEDGVFVSLQDEENMADWIGLFGDLPEDWDEDWLEEASEMESCNYDYSGTCYSQYASCMLIMGNEDFVEAYEAQYGEMVRMSDFLECTAVDWDGEDKSGYQNNYWYQSDCEEGEDCEENNDENEGEDGEAQQLYVGPSCSNSKTIKLAVYSDYYCSVLTDLTVQQVLGDVLMDADDSNGSPIDMIPKTCISCQQDVNDMWYENEEVDGSEAGLNSMCAMLYQYSGKCNANLDNYDTYSSNSYYAANDNNNGDGEGDDQESYNYKQMYQSEAQAENEGAVCSFINMLTSQTYSDNGEIVLTNNFSKNWRKEFAIQSSYMSAGMKAGLVLSAFAVAVMVIWAVVLHSTLSRKHIPWRPRRGRASAEANEFSRNQSGIVVGRNNGASPLI